MHTHVPTQTPVWNSFNKMNQTRTWYLILDLGNTAVMRHSVHPLSHTLCVCCQFKNFDTCHRVTKKLQFLRVVSGSKFLSCLIKSRSFNCCCNKFAAVGQFKQDSLQQSECSSVFRCIAYTAQTYICFYLP